MKNEEVREPETKKPTHTLEERMKILEDKIFICQVSNEILSRTVMEIGEVDEDRFRKVSMEQTKKFLEELEKDKEE